MKKSVIFVVILLLLIPIVYSAVIQHPISVQKTEKINLIETQERERPAGDVEHYIYGVNGLVAVDDGEVTYIHADHLGSNRIVTNELGEIEEETKYLPFGEALQESDSRFTYTGKELDKGSKLQYSGARYYDQDIGRFTQVDPIKDGLNWYVYTGNNPMNYIDPSGTQIVEANWDIILESKREQFFYEHYGPKVEYFNFPPIYLGTGESFSAYAHDTQRMISRFNRDERILDNPTPLETASFLAEGVYRAAPSRHLINAETVFNKPFPGLGDFFYKGNLDFGTPAVLAHILKENENLKDYGIYIGRFDFITKTTMVADGEFYDAGENIETVYNVVLRSSSNGGFVIHLDEDKIKITPFSDYVSPDIQTEGGNSDINRGIEETSLNGYQLERVDSLDFLTRRSD